MMKKSTLVMQANQLLQAGDFEYAIGGGQAIDLFLGYESRMHGDIDVIAFLKEREGYQQDFELAYGAMNEEQQNWLKTALCSLYPQGHKWISYMQP